LSSRDAYTAIADPTRRKILSLLRDRGPLQAGQIAERFSRVSRPGISRHLRILRECGVVRAERDGREQHYAMNPAPLLKIRDEFLASFAPMQVASLKALRARVERRPAHKPTRPT
jgi:DNA-binding transcriptional ArsR family regulator